MSKSSPNPALILEAAVPQTAIGSGPSKPTPNGEDRSSRQSYLVKSCGPNHRFKVRVAELFESLKRPKVVVIQEASYT